MFATLIMRCSHTDSCTHVLALHVMGAHAVLVRAYELVNKDCWALY